MVEWFRHGSAKPATLVQFRLPTPFMYINNQPQIVSSNRVRVLVGQQEFSIPMEKVNDVVRLLSQLQGIQIENPSPPLSYQGKTLLNG